MVSHWTETGPGNETRLERQVSFRLRQHKKFRLKFRKKDRFMPERRPDGLRLRDRDGFGFRVQISFRMRREDELKQRHKFRFRLRQGNSFRFRHIKRAGFRLWLQVSGSNLDGYTGLGFGSFTEAASCSDREKVLGLDIKKGSGLDRDSFRARFSNRLKLKLRERFRLWQQ